MESLKGEKENGKEKHGRFSKMHLSTQGYVVVKAPEDYENAFTDGRVLEHRLVAEQKLGRALLPHEICHHINGIKIDNRPENIEVTTRSNHPLEHGNPQLLPGQSVKTHCPKGHPYNEENTYHHPSGRRVCRICQREAKVLFKIRHGGN